MDILETEILDDNNEPRIFGKDIVKVGHTCQATIPIKHSWILVARKYVKTSRETSHVKYEVHVGWHGKLHTLISFNGFFYDKF